MISRRILGVVAAAEALVLAVLVPNAGSTAAVAQPPGWQKVALPTGGHTIYGLSHVAFTDAQHGWILGTVNMGVNKVVRAALWFTADGGSTWRQRWTPSAQSPGTAAFVDASHGWYAKRAGTTAEIYRTADSGRTWALQATLPGDVVSMTAVDRTRMADGQRRVPRRYDGRPDLAHAELTDEQLRAEPAIGRPPRWLAGRRRRTPLHDR